jgi:hypothetical protein
MRLFGKISVILGLLLAMSSLTSVCAAQENNTTQYVCPSVLKNDRNNTAEVHFNDVRDDRYAEILMTCSGAGTGIFNTMGLNNNTNPNSSLPDNLFANYSSEAVEEQYNSPMVFMNGPRNWTMDAINVKLSNNVRNLDGLDTRWAADIEVPAGANLSESEQAYKPMPVQCNRTWFFDKGKPVFILVDPNGTNYVMQSYCQIVDKNLTYNDLQTLGNKLRLAQGWEYRVVVLPENLTMEGIGVNGTDWQVTQDDLQNTYSACLKKDNETTCHYRPYI